MALDNIIADIGRLNTSGKFSFRSLIAGLLSQGFQAILVYRFLLRPQNLWVKGLWFLKIGGVAERRDPKNLVA